ncbi:MAG: DNA methyltransferase, partial [Candidatus Saccharimonadales bacterium]
MPNRTSMQDIDRLVNMLKSEPGYDHGLELARRIVALLGASMSDTEAFLQDQKVIQHEGWFLKHPVLTSQRACVSLNVDPDAHVQAKFYCLGKDAKKSMRQRIMAAVHFTPNYEDAEFTRQQKLPIGIDFFLHPDGDAMTIALSNRGLVRVLTLEGHLTNTAKTILSNWSDMSGIFEQERLHSALWDSFQLQEVNKKFYKEIARFFTDLTQHLVSKNIFENDDAKQYTNRLIGRLLFVWFLRKKGVINESENYFAVTTNSDTYYEEHLRKLFFAKLNTPIDERKDQKTPYLNGGLFDESELDQNDAISFPTGYFANIFHFFDEYNFTTDESTPDFEQVAIDPEMLGRIFENLLAEQVDETKVNARKASGAFYTPREIVDYMCRESLRQYLYTQLDGKVLDHTIVVDKLIDTSEQEWTNDESNQTKHLFEKRPADRDEVRRALERMKVLDPACGSGAFPMGMMQLLVRIFQRIDRKLDEYEVKLGIMQSTIYGVDINPMAADISRLRAWLSLVVDEVPEKLRNEPLPNLDFKFITANSLIPLAEGDSLDIFGENNLGDKLADLRDKYFRARSKESKQKLRLEYRSLTSQVGLSSSQRSKQLQSFDPFDSTKCAQFFDIDYMFGVNGFDIVIGNPPYIDYRKIDKSTKDIIADYKIAHHSKMINLYTYFFELGIKQLSISGILAYISPQQYLILDNCKGLRDIIRDIRLVSLSDFARAKVFSAATYTFVSLLQNSPPDESITYREFNNIYDLTNPLKKILLP